MKRATGICLGASTLGLVQVRQENGQLHIDKVLVKTHEGNPRAVMVSTLGEFPDDPVAITGRKFRNMIDLPQISEVEAMEEALEFILNRGEEPPQAIISAGSESFIIYPLDSSGKVRGINTGSKCASGTGEFFLQQLRRMNVTPDEAIEKALQVEKPYKISGRCSVFCKSDCTHALNRGEPIGNISAGLCDMMVKKMLEILRRIPRKNIMLLGGISKNRAVVKLLQKEVKNLTIPEEAPFFEALGAALWAARNSEAYPSGQVFKSRKSSFDFLPALPLSEHLVTFKKSVRGKVKKNDRCLIGLDVGSTTTKAVLMRISDNAILSSCYLRTNGDPIGASKKCFEAIQKEVTCPISIHGLGVTGSGRYIAGLFAQTDAIINEIIAHAEAALYFDADVDTIFEIGGQDAKYTYIINGVPCDYAMNEACSAGTGSFLEESAKESLGIAMEDIAEIAMKSKKPPNFNDQCAAFIGSDIKSAIHEGIPVEDIIAGLVYSICMNYSNKVKGSRPYGKKIFMQGGVCYNRAIPVAMASLIGCPIVVPPEPGLMGAFGVALELKKRQSLGFLKEHSFSLGELLSRKVQYGKEFTCQGGKEKCDRKCTINIIRIGEKNYPFGGACNRYYNMGEEREIPEAANLIKERYGLLFLKYVKPSPSGPSIGINRSFMTHTLFPLYYHFFTLLGFRVVLPEVMHEEGVERKGAYFCHPLEVSHGYYLDLLRMNPDFIFLPHIREIQVPNSVSTKHDFQATCHLLQSETYCLREAFSDLEQGTHVLRPIFDFSKGFASEKKSFIKLARTLGKDKKLASMAFEFALQKQQQFQKALKEIGRAFLKKLEENSDDMAVVLFGRPYNAFAPDLNMGIPEKFSSRNISIIPYDMLSFDDEYCDKQMHWATGQTLMKAAQFVRRHKQLYAVYITNFSCGPDSFLQRYFRDIMGRKPSLTLELDSHTADAGITTRVEAFLDIVQRYRKLKLPETEKTNHYRPAVTVVENNAIKVTTSEGDVLTPRDSRVRLLLPSMGSLLTEAAGAALTASGYNAVPLPEPDFDVLKKGRANTTCKECLPLILITGMLEKYLEQDRPADEVSLLFVPTAEGGCRLGQYCVFLKNHIERKQLRNVSILALDNENGYAGLGDDALQRVAQGMVVSDVMDDIYSAVYALSRDRSQGLEQFSRSWKRICETFAAGRPIEPVLHEVASELREVPLKLTFDDACKVLLCGEIYVRKERFASGAIIRSLGDKEIVVKTSSSNEWMLYVDWMIQNNIYEHGYGLREMLNHHVKHYYKKFIDTRYRRILSRSGLCDAEILDINKIMEYGKKLVSVHIGGDPILSCGASMKDILHSVSGIVMVGPFACMQSRITEAILCEAMTPDRKMKVENGKFHMPEGVAGLPFLAIETDGNIFPQLIEAKLETFALQSKRIYDRMRAHAGR